MSTHRNFVKKALRHAPAEVRGLALEALDAAMSEARENAIRECMELFPDINETNEWIRAVLEEHLSQSCDTLDFYPLDDKVGSGDKS